VDNILNKKVSGEDYSSMTDEFGMEMEKPRIVCPPQRLTRNSAALAQQMNPDASWKKIQPMTIEAGTSIQSTSKNYSKPAVHLLLCRWMIDYNYELKLIVHGRDLFPLYV
jgi:hypothetical protein